MKLKKIREKRGMTQIQLSDTAKISIRTIQHYEQGSKLLDHARIDTILKICLALHCKLEDIIENEAFLDLLSQYNS